MRAPRAAAAALIALGAIGCGDGGPPANVEGSYSIAVTNGMNGCQLGNWQEGGSTQNIGLTLNQDASDAAKVTGTIEGVTGGLVRLWLGSNVFTGTVHGSAIDMSILGTNAMRMGTCAFTTNARAQATVDRSGVIAGTIRYTYATNGTPDCGYRTACETRQNFNGTRPPPP